MCPRGHLVSLGEALEFTLRWEGGYANIQGDRGGETYRGISRRAHPDWPGWPIIDGFKLQSPIRHNQIFPQLEDSVGRFYKAEYWDRVSGNDLPSLVALTVFDHAVHSGVRRASKALQREVGAKVDGAIGDRTVTATWDHCDRLGARVLVSYRKVWLEGLIARRPSQEKFRFGWMRRIAALRKIIKGI
jgi:lysozyme family protein